MNIQKIATTTLLALGLSSAAVADHHGKGKKASVKQGVKAEKVVKKKGMQKKRRMAARVCFGKLTQDQRQDLRANRAKRMKMEKKLNMQLRKARKAYQKVVANQDSTKKEARKALRKVQNTRAKLIKVRSNARMNLMYDVLDADQRVKASKCMKRVRMQAKKGKMVQVGKKVNPKIQEKRAERMKNRAERMKKRAAKRAQNNI